MLGFDIKSNIWKMYLLNFLRNLQFFGAVAIPFFLDWAKISYTRIFILEAAFMFWIFVLEIPTGVVADKYGRKASIILGGLFSAVSIAIFGFINNYWAFFLAEFIGAFGFTLLSGADKALIYDSLIQTKQDKDAGVFLSRYESAGTLGILIGFPLGSLIAGSSILPYPKTLPLTFIISGIFLLLTFFVALTLNEPKRKEKVKDFIKEGFDGFKYIFKHKKLRVFALNFALISATTFFMFWFYQSLAGVIGIDVKYNGFIGAGFNLFSMLLLLNIKRIEKLFGMKNTLFYSAILPGLFFIGLFFFRNIYFVLIAIFIITGLKIMRAPVLSDFMNRHIESRNRATVLSGVSMLEKIMVMILYPIVGLLADFSLWATFLFLGIATLVFSLMNRIESEHIE
ncbi:MAG: MFS transporter [Candidatus Woesearchaeota archaeon]|nr:MAG: MFS transporter [Candidatus Woesearchaeota archaeon]